MKYHTLQRRALSQQVGNSLGSIPGVKAVSMIFLRLRIVWIIHSKKGRHTLEHAGPGNRDLSSCTYIPPESVPTRTPDLIMGADHGGPP